MGRSMRRMVCMLTCLLGSIQTAVVEMCLIGTVWVRAQSQYVPCQVP